MTRLVASFLRDERGAVQVEYALIAGLVGVVTVFGLTALGDAMDGAYQPIVRTSGGPSHDLPAVVAPSD
jgi:Flp pilus assembly pilin Flp